MQMNSQKTLTGFTNRMKLLITGAAGYVGAMLSDQFSKLPQVEAVLGLDKDPMPKILSGNKKVSWLQANTSDGAWEERAKNFAPDIVINTAWQIRPIYGDEAKEWKWNVDGSTAVFNFTLTSASVKKLIHFSTASVYGAYPENTLEHYFKEEEPLREDVYPYGIQKRQVEENLYLLLKKAGKGNGVQVSVVRPAAITGPRGRAMTHRFGLQSSLSGKLTGSRVYSLVRLLVSRVPATEGWVRQFVHEDDVVDIISRLTLGETPWAMEIFNLAPPGEAVRPIDMARAVGKKVLWIYPSVVRFAFFWIRHLTMGIVPTARGSWKFYSYPLLMDGSKVTRLLGHRYSAGSKEAFSKNEGRYRV